MVDCRNIYVCIRFIWIKYFVQYLRRDIFFFVYEELFDLEMIELMVFLKFNLIYKEVLNEQKYNLYFKDFV